MFKSNLRLSTVFLVLASQLATASPEPGPTEGPNCPNDLAKLAASEAKQVAADAEARETAKETRVLKMTEEVLAEIRRNSDSAEALDAAIDRLREKFAIRPEDSNSAILQESVAKLREYGESTQSVLDLATELGREVGAVKIMAAKDTLVTKFLKTLPIVRNRIQTAQERNQSGQQAISNLSLAVDNQVADIRRMDKLAKRDELTWREESDDFWNKAEELGGVADAVESTLASLDGLTPLQKRGYEHFIEELRGAEVLFRDQAQDLQESVLTNQNAQEGLKETKQVLQMTTKGELRTLGRLAANTAINDVSLKGQELADHIHESVETARANVSEMALQSTRKMTELLKKINDRTGTQQAREKRREAARNWKEYGDAARVARTELNAKLKEDYKKGAEEIAEHDVRAKTSQAVFGDEEKSPANQEAPATPESAEEVKKVEPEVRPQ